MVTRRDARRGLQLLTAGRLDQAEQTYRRLLQQHPRHPVARHHLGVIALRRGQPERAVKLIRQALAAEPRMADAHSNLGLALGALGRLEEARASFRRAIDLRPEYPEAHYNHGLALDTEGRLEAALESYEAAIELKPAYADAQANRAMVLHALKQHEQAITGYRRALELAPSLHRLWAYLALALATLNRAEETADALDRATRHDPDDPLIAVARATLADHDDDFENTSEHLDDALRRLTRREFPQPAPTALSPPNYPVGRYLEAVSAVMAATEKHGCKPFLYGGTLLGAVRDGNFMHFDKDIDFGIPASIRTAGLLAMLSTNPDFTVDHDIDDDAPLIAVRFQQKVAIDFFRFFDDGDSTWCAVPFRGQLMKWRHRPFSLVRTTLHGVTVYQPDEPEHMLAEMYGPNWTTPNPHFALFASPNIDGGFSSVCRYIARGLMVRAAMTGHAEKLNSLCEQVLNLDPDDATARSLRQWVRNGAAFGPDDASRAPDAPTAILEDIADDFDNLPG